ncbi:MAG: HAD family hydrolase, partial [Erysipelotrichaceae bacterium]|nr:HAD family hydrolase [Erysipelotrichaceae bacterium]
CRRAREILAQLPVSAAETAPGGFEIGCPEANKYLGIQRVCRELGLDPAEAAYLGDSENDRSVFGRVGISVAMGNAPQGLKKIAALVADNYDDDGAAKAIEQLMKQ